MLPETLWKILAGENIDSLLTRFDMARHEAASVGAGMENYHILATILLRAVRVTAEQTMNLLQPNNGRMPINQQQYDALVNRLRAMGHILERSPENIMTGLHGRQQSTFMTLEDNTQTFASDATSSSIPWGVNHQLQ